jgi:hypothetical protein
MTEKCPICNPKEPEEKNVAVLLRGRIASDPSPGNPDQELFKLALKDIEHLRENVKSMRGQLAHIGHLGTNMADSVKRNFKIDGGWEP